MASTSPDSQLPWYRRARLARTAGAATLAGVLALTFVAGSATARADGLTVNGFASAYASTPTRSLAETGQGSAAADSYGAPSRQGTGGYPGGGSTGTVPDRYAGSTSTQEAATTADDEESTGVVLIDTTLGYSQSEAAGTGMVLTSDGLVLTNNHVIEDSTEITVTDASTGQSYTATVVGSNADEDVALLQLEDASGLATVTLDDDDETVGDTITAVGNASGGGVLMAADGTITALEAEVTTQSLVSAQGETLDGMIEISAAVVSGDSGGAVLDDEGEVIGMTTAASSGTAIVTAYAIPIEDAMSIVDQILAGDTSDGVTLGYPAFLGVQVSAQTSATNYGYGAGAARQYGRGPQSDTGSAEQSTTEGAAVAGVYTDTPAAEAGLEAGDVITAVDGTTITDASSLSSTLATYSPGDSVQLTWTDASGETQTATVTLIEGPAS